MGKLLKFMLSILFSFMPFIVVWVMVLFNKYGGFTNSNGQHLYIDFLTTFHNFIDPFENNITVDFENLKNNLSNVISYFKSNYLNTAFLFSNIDSLSSFFQAIGSFFVLIFSFVGLIGQFLYYVVVFIGSIIVDLFKMIASFFSLFFNPVAYWI